MTLQNLPELAGLCGMTRAHKSEWSVEESTLRLKRIHYSIRRLHEILTSRITAEPIYELKTLFSHHAYLCAEQVSLIRKRVAEMREPPLELDKVPHPGLQRLMDEVECAPSTYALLRAVYEIMLPAIVDASRQLRIDAHPLADAPTCRTAKLVAFELAEIIPIGQQCVRALESGEPNEQVQNWIELLRQCIKAAGGLDGTCHGDAPVPERCFSKTGYVYDATPCRDPRFKDPYNAGVNAEAFLYDQRFSPQDKTIMMYYKRLRELDVPEMMASILVELRDEEPWDFHMEMSRQLWDEARHAMMGEVGFAAIGIDWQEIPINFTWSRNLNLQLDARERHGVLFYIEQNLMPKTGKRYEWEVATASGDPLARLFQDFDWADEVLHAHIGRRWYVSRYETLKQSLDYGDRCWSKVMSHWRQFRDQGLTEHRNWWPEIYAQACEKWNKTPDPQALAFSETYEETRADLKEIAP